MCKKKKVVVLLEQLEGGVFTVVSNLCKALIEKDYQVIIIPTQQPIENVQTAYLSSLDKRVNIYYLKNDTIKYNSLKPRAIFFIAKARIKIARIFGKRPSNVSIINKRYAQSLYRKVNLLKRFFKTHNDSVVVALAHHSIWLTMLALRKIKVNKIIISERSDPNTEATGRTCQAFIKELYPKADKMVFQTPDAMQWYKDRIDVKGEVIFNPVRANLPEAFVGERKKIIVDFCRINPQKNLILLIKAFEKIWLDYSDFQLHIYGDDNGLTPEYTSKFLQAVKNSCCNEAIKVFPARSDIHDLVKDHYMFVSSSDYEGMSNSMLEAMAIGLPTVCTDCPIGGARAVIKDHFNGILTPVGDVDALYFAMKELIDSPELSKKISSNGVNIRNTQSLDTIVSQWIKVIEE